VGRASSSASEKRIRHNWLESFVREGLVRSWWVYLFALICYGCYEFMNGQQQNLLAGLRGRLREHEVLIATENERQAELRLQLASQEDPAWLELVLKRCLGVVPSDQTKVYFYSATPGDGPRC
jgi:hypothetical protein